LLTQGAEDRKTVAGVQAEDHFARGDYKSAAQEFAKSGLALEDVSLRFVSAGQTAALALYIKLKLDALPKSDTAQGVLLSSWLLELKLSLLDLEADEQGVPSPSKLDGSARLNEMKAFFQRYKDRLHHDTVYSLLSQHGMEDYVLLFAEAVHDNDRGILN
jgi:vacuolar protein sorting-associated protein 18